jgi:ATP-dependent 26S proteasome regulatory subunit
VQAVKEMVLLPLLYPELFDRFHFSPPRGVLFYGPPGQLTAPAVALLSAAAAAAVRVCH